MSKKDIVIDNMAISREFVEKHKTEAEFLEAMSKGGYAGHLEGENREAKLKEVYKQAQPVQDGAAMASINGGDAGTSKEGKKK